MELHFEQVIPVPRETAWRAFHEQIEALPPWLPHVEHIRVLDHQREGRQRSRCEHAWGLDQSVIPAVARPFLGERLRELRSSTLWHHDAHRVEFCFFVDSTEGLVECDGHFMLETRNGETRVTIDARLEVHPHMLPGVPRFLGNTVRPAVKRIVEETIGPTLAALPDALTRLFMTRDDPGALAAPHYV